MLQIPKDVDGIALVANAMNKFNLELAGGLGPSAGLCWRVGLLGYNCRVSLIPILKNIAVVSSVHCPCTEQKAI